MMLAAALVLGGCFGGKSTPDSAGAPSSSVSDGAEAGSASVSSSESAGEPEPAPAAKPAPSAVQPEVSSSAPPVSSSGAPQESSSSTATAAGDVVQPETTLAQEARPHAFTSVELNLRKGPGTDYDRIEILPEGATVIEAGYSASAPEWLYVEWDGQFGWVAAEYLNFEGGGMAKPVIYLYPTRETDVQVRVEFAPGYDFTCTYPAYNNGWRVTAQPDGSMVNHADGREYSYLYWEGAGPAEYDMGSGFVVPGGDTAAFLQEKLAYLGLTPEEYNEFIVYWLPQMQANPYNLITFQGAAYADKAKLVVTPKPDSMLRVFMVYQPLQQPVDVPEQVLAPFARTGFAVVEWGGTRLGAEGTFG